MSTLVVYGHLVKKYEQISAHLQYHEKMKVLYCKRPAKICDAVQSFVSTLYTNRSYRYSSNVRTSELPTTVGFMRI